MTRFNKNKPYRIIKEICFGEKYFSIHQKTEDNSDIYYPIDNGHDPVILCFKSLKKAKKYVYKIINTIDNKIIVFESEIHNK